MALVDEIPVIDCDSHVTEPPDLWTSRLSGRWRDGVPHVIWDERLNEHRWLVGDRKLNGVASFAMAGWHEYSPAHPPSLEEADPGAHDPRARLSRLDEYGVHAQVIYPNLLGFYVPAFLDLEPALALDCVRAYNDFLAEFCSVDPKRLVPLMFLPFWDLDASLAEMKRALDLGHKGLVFGVDFAKVGLPPITDPTWDPLLSAAEDAELSINFHIGFSQVTEDELRSQIRLQDRVEFVKNSALMMLGNARAVADVVTSDICARHPGLNFVSVESGCGWLLFLLEALDWQWENTGAHLAFPEREFPSVYFRRQVYGSFWFERDSMRRTIGALPDNVMFETDFPHPTSLCPGPASSAENPRDAIERALGDLPRDVVQKVLHDTAARLYHLE
ncbi:MAG: putative amidohydrolase [Acidimicrobiales bacterium]|jgi:predicted TIM-barrel fold metal-dependent hydrolase|nr:putative amidohydrolase [Acidimicrobiales bacterium]